MCLQHQKNQLGRGDSSWKLVDSNRNACRTRLCLTLNLFKYNMKSLAFSWQSDLLMNESFLHSSALLLLIWHQLADIKLNRHSQFTYTFEKFQEILPLVQVSTSFLSILSQTSWHDPIYFLNSLYQWMGAVRMRVQMADKNITIIHK